MSPVGFDTDGAGGESYSILVATLLREAGEAYPFPGTLPRPGLLPVPVAVHRSANAISERLLADLGPPRVAGASVDAFGLFGLVPAGTHPEERRLVGPEFVKVDESIGC